MRNFRFMLTVPMAAASLVITLLVAAGLAWGGPNGAAAAGGAGLILAAAVLGVLFRRVDGVLAGFHLWPSRWLAEDFSCRFEGREQGPVGAIGVRLHKCNKGMGKYIAGLKDHTAQLIQAARGVRAAAREVDELAGRQAADGRVLLEATGKLVRDTGTGREGAAAAVEMAEHSARTAGAGEEVLGRLTGDLADLAAAVDRTRTVTSSMAGIVEVIEGVAGQVNLLALNAAIEAARAGSHGTGFGVVAEEVRRLAEKSAAATAEIGALLTGVTAAVAEAASALKKGGQLNEQAGGEFTRIVGSIRRTGEAVREIALDADRQGSMAQAMAGQAGSITGLIREAVAATKEVSGVAGEMEELAGRLEETVAGFRSCSAEF